MRRRNTWGSLSTDWSAIGGDEFETHQRRRRTADASIWIHYRNTSAHGKPNPPERVCNYRLITLHTFYAMQAIRKAVVAQAGTRGTCQQVGALYAQNVTGSCDPQSSALIFRNSEYLLAQQFRCIARNFNVAGRKEGKPGGTPDPKCAGRIHEQAVQIRGGQSVGEGKGVPMTLRKCIKSIRGGEPHGPVRGFCNGSHGV